MPKPKKGGGRKGSELGRAIIRRAAVDSRVKRSAGLGFAIADSLADASAPLQSVTDMTSLEDFLSHAAMAEKNFTAEKADVAFVNNSYHPHGAVADRGTGKSASNGSTVLRWLRIPRRPRWDEGMGAAELHTAEMESFLTWRRDVARMEEEVQAQVGGLSLGGTGVGSSGEASVTPFEKNLSIWQQLWRVIERSDVLVQIVDARDPLFYYCPDVDAYVREVNPGKRTLIIVNKADYLTPAQRAGWAGYLESRGLDFIFFSAKSELAKMEEEDAARRGGGGIVPGLRDAEGRIAEAGSEDERSEAGEDAGSDSEAEGGRKGVAPGDVQAAVAAALSTGSSGAKGGAKAARKAAKRAAAAAKAAAAKTNSKFAALLDDDEEGADAEEGQEAAADGSAASAAAADAAADAAAAEADEVALQAGLLASAAVPAATAGAPPAPPAASTAAAEPAADAAAAAPAAAAGASTEAIPAVAAEADPETDPRLRILSRDELLSFFTAHYADVPRGVLGSASTNPAGAARLKELRAKERAAARAARAEELRRRQDLREKMIQAGLGAAIRFGDERDVAALEEADDEDEDDEGAAIGDTGLPPPLMIGMVGYPNVGKSSTINALLGATASAHSSYRVAVAATPGKTKHFQTLPLTDEVTLVDCPGLVFPSFVATREEMVVNGVLPIDQMREHVGPMRLVCSRIPRSVFEGMYGFHLPTPPPPQNPRRQPTPLELLDAFCTARGFMGAGHSGPDHPRGSRVLLKDYTDGRLLFVHPPPEGGWGRWAPGGEAAAASANVHPGLAPGGGAFVGAPLGAGAGPAAPEGSAVKSAGAGGGKWDNVLLPTVAAQHVPETGATAVAGKPTGSIPAAAFRPGAQPATTAAAAAAPAVAEADADDQSSEGSLVSDDEEEGGAAAAGGKLDEAALRAFSRVVYLAGDGDDSSDDGQLHDDDDLETVAEKDGEEDDDGSSDSGEEGAGGGAAGAGHCSVRSAAVSGFAAGAAGAAESRHAKAAVHSKAKSMAVPGGGAHVKGRPVVPVAGSASTSSAAAAGARSEAAGAGAGAAAEHDDAASDDGRRPTGSVAASRAAGAARAAPKGKMRKDRRSRKGEKRWEDDPYGTSAVADAANRRYHLEEVAAVSQAARAASGW